MTAPEPLPPARAAATVVIVRDGDTGLEALLLERSAVGAFAGMWVFPGGRVDDDDVGADDLERARSAAVREAAEEVGLVVDPAELVPWAHWTPPPVTPKRYITWFFVAPWSGGAVQIDQHEIVGHAWRTPADALASGIPMAPPTFVTLHQLASFGSVAEVRASRPGAGVEFFATRHAPIDGGVALLWHGDVGYESLDLDIPGPRHRALMLGLEVSSYERT